MKKDKLLYLIVTLLISLNIYAQEQGDSSYDYKRFAFGFEANYGVILNKNIDKRSVELNSGLSEIGGYIAFRTGYLSNIRSGLLTGNSIKNDLNFKYLKIPLSYDIFISQFKREKSTENGRPKSVAGLKLGMGIYYSINNSFEGKRSGSFRDTTSNNFGGEFELSFSRNSMVYMYLKYAQDFSPFKE